jgi:PAS domain S-box-containing protein
MPRSEDRESKRTRKQYSKHKPKPVSTPPRPGTPDNALLHELFDDLELGFANVLPSGEIVYSNPKFSMSLGHPPHRDLSGQNLRNFVAPHSWESLDAALRQATLQPVIGEIKLNTTADKTQTIRLSLSPARVMARPVIRIIADEVTELVETNLQLRETEASLRALSGRILQLQDQERRKMARDLHDTTGQELAVLVMSLRHLADSVDRPGIDMHTALVDASELARKVNDEIRTLSYVLHPPLLDQLGLGSALKWYVEGFCSRSGIDVKLVIPEALDRFSSEQETALFRVVQEGLTNVMRHSSSRSVKIVVCASTDEIELTVKDDGSGIPRAALDRLAAGTGAKSLGVGIAGLRERLHQLGGKLEIFSNHSGTTLKATVPIERGAEATPAVSDEPPEHAGPLAGQLSANDRKRILIVDDHELMRRGIRGFIECYPDLEICGEARDGAEAVKKTHELHPDLVILDLNMPGSGGLSAANQLQSDGSDSEILVFTTHSFPGIERALRSAGCKGLVSKLHAERDLLRGIREVLAGREFYNSAPAHAQTA